MGTIGHWIKHAVHMAAKLWVRRRMSCITDDLVTPVSTGDLLNVVVCISWDFGYAQNKLCASWKLEVILWFRCFPTPCSLILLIFLFIYITFISVYLSVCRSVCLSVILSFCRSFCLSIYRSIYIYRHCSIYPSIFLYFNKSLFYRSTYTQKLYKMYRSYKVYILHTYVHIQVYILHTYIHIHTYIQNVGLFSRI